MFPQTTKWILEIKSVWLSMWCIFLSASETTEPEKHFWANPQGFLGANLVKVTIWQCYSEEQVRSLIESLSLNIPAIILSGLSLFFCLGFVHVFAPPLCNSFLPQLSPFLFRPCCLGQWKILIFVLSSCALFGCSVKFRFSLSQCLLFYFVFVFMN